MPIVIEFGASEVEYIELEKQYHCPRPENCSICHAVGQMIGHGYYLRKPKGVEKGWILWVKRWKCKACKHTVGAVPSFLLFYRHYLLVVIQMVIVWRFEAGYSWLRLDAAVSEDGVPSRRTKQRWCGSFVEHTGEWLAALEKTLAEQDSGSPWLDAQGEGLKMGSTPRALLKASLHLLAWAKGRWRELEGFVLNDRLRWLWYWGNRHIGLQRLI
jgi:hypothetical protein